MSHSREYVDIGSLELLMPCGDSPISHGQLEAELFLFQYKFYGFLSSSARFHLLSGHGMLLIRCGVAEIVFAQLLI